MSTAAQWKEEYRDKWQAESHYDERRAEAYTAQNATAQQRLTEHTLQLMGEPKGPGLALDLGCGSGLSSSALVTSGMFVIGTDLSPSMLALCPSERMDVVRADLGQRLPFRASVADCVSSIGAAHYLLDRCAHTGRTAVERTRALFGGIKRCCCLSARRASVLQFIPRAQAGGSCIWSLIWSHQLHPAVHLHVCCLQQPLTEYAAAGHSKSGVKKQLRINVTAQR